MIYKPTQGHLEGLRAKVVSQIGGPRCKFCSDKEGRRMAVRSEEIVEHAPGEKDYALMLVKCHGQEELMRFEMGSTNWGWKELARKMYGHTWFDLRKLAEMAR